MAPSDEDDEIVQSGVNLGAPTGEGRWYKTKSGRKWYSAAGTTMIQSGNDYGVITLGSKFGPSRVKRY